MNDTPQQTPVDSGWWVRIVGNADGSMECAAGCTKWLDARAARAFLRALEVMAGIIEENDAEKRTTEETAYAE